ncbi:MAG: flagellar motor protein MotB [Spirochaetae bacterium HGW-Spirochaetae-1]|jgi:chemotaxis protein MotB|nr:MAG: flagellar motor protein MotB [Spirochaetae bacterium HGW-Spirochaetae-1]
MPVKRNKKQKKGTPSWMVSMGDLNNLLMCFFIVMMGDTTEVIKEEFLLTMSSFRGSLGVLEGGKTITKGKLSEMGNNIMSLPSSQKKARYAQMLRKATEILKPEIQSRQVRVSEDERGLIISISSDLFFDPGSAMLKTEARDVLGRVGTLLKNLDNFIRVEGHTDNKPVKVATEGKGYSSNWELSSARSVNVVKFLAEEESINPRQLSAVAFAQYRPIDENNAPEGRAYNRRVDIVVLTEKGLEESKNKKVPRPLPDEEWQR